MKLLVTGGTIFVSRYIAEYFVAKGDEVYVLNRNTKKQSRGVHLIEADRYNIGERLRESSFDVVIDTGYNAKEVELLLDAIGSFKDYIFISSSAVYPEYERQPFKEEAKLGENKYWRRYGTDKIEAEKSLLKRNPNAYILRPPYLYGPMNNVYREAFVFDCAMMERRFYLPKDGSMKLQFFHVQDLCKFIEITLEKKPREHIFNVGNEQAISVKDWVELGYLVAGKNAELVNVYADMDQRKYFSFYDYEYCLDIQRQKELMPETKPLQEGLREAYEWYIDNKDSVNRKNYLEFIDEQNFNYV